MREAQKDGNRRPRKGRKLEDNINWTCPLCPEPVTMKTKWKQKHLRLIHPEEEIAVG